MKEKKPICKVTDKGMETLRFFDKVRCGNCGEKENITVIIESGKMKHKCLKCNYESEFISISSLTK